MSLINSHSVEAILQQLPIPIDPKIISPSKLPLMGIVQSLGEELNVRLGEISKILTILELVRATLELHRRVADGTERDQDNKLAILAGDYLFSRSLMLISALKNPRLEKIIFKSITTATKGDLVISLNAEINKRISLNKYIHVVKKYQTSLFQLAFTLTAEMADVKKTKKYEKAGKYFGLFYRLIQEAEKYNTGNTSTCGYWDFPLLLLKKGKNLPSQENGGIILSHETRQLAYNKAKNFIDKHLHVLSKKITALHPGLNQKLTLLFN